MKNRLEFAKWRYPLYSNGGFSGGLPFVKNSDEKE